MRRGTNYLICVTEDNIMFKSWIKDVVETKNYQEVPMKNIKKLVEESYKKSKTAKTKGLTNVSGVPADQREVGTDSLRKYAMRMTNTTHIQNFINRYRKK